MSDGLISSDHCLMVEQLRRHAKFFLPSGQLLLQMKEYSERGPSVSLLPSVETPENVLLLCMDSDEVVSARSTSFINLFLLFPGLPLSHITPGSVRRVLKTLIFTGPTNG